MIGISCLASWDIAMARPANTYRAARRNLAKRARLVWRTLNREKSANGEVRVMVPGFLPGVGK